jgi:hypothetical protein
MESSNIRSRIVSPPVLSEWRLSFIQFREGNNHVQFFLRAISQKIRFSNLSWVQNDLRPALNIFRSFGQQRSKPLKKDYWAYLIRCIVCSRPLPDSRYREGNLFCQEWDIEGGSSEDNERGSKSSKYDHATMVFGGLSIEDVHKSMPMARKLNRHKKLFFRSKNWILQKCQTLWECFATLIGRLCLLQSIERIKAVDKWNVSFRDAENWAELHSLFHKSRNKQCSIREMVYVWKEYIDKEVIQVYLDLEKNNFFMLDFTISIWFRPHKSEKNNSKLIQSSSDSHSCGIWLQW